MHAPAPICAMPLLDPAGVLAEINRTWQSAAPDEIAELLEPYFTEDVVVVAPSLARVARGRAAVAASYGDFVRNAKVLELTIEEPQIDFAGDVAVATMAWRMRYEFGGRQSRERGHDTYVFRRDAGDWRICWRSLLSAADESAAEE
jgi:ketosteroid isomerase-like protein